MDNDEIAKRLEQVAMQSQDAKLLAVKALEKIEGHEKKCETNMAFITTAFVNIEKRLDEGRDNFKKITDDITDIKTTLAKYATAIVIIFAGIEFYLKIAQ